MIQFKWYPFSELSLQQLYALLALRAEVFVVEQHCFYLDPDGKDLETIHLLGTEEGSLIAYLRLFPPTTSQNKVVFGRVVTIGSSRAKGYGKKMMQELLDYCQKHFPDHAIECSAQAYLQRFYGSFGFKAYGEIYDDAGIPHIKMRKDV